MAYNFIKLVHLLAVVLFMGNIITGLFWMRIAVKTRDLNIVHFTMKGIIKADRYFTIPGVIIITAMGFLGAIQGRFPIFGTGWILWSIIMFSISGLVFGIRVAPLQQKIARLTQDLHQNQDYDWMALRSLVFQWDLWGLIAVLTPLAAFVMMVLKYPS